jgi:hypothetical protein
MDAIISTPHVEARHMALRGVIRLAGEVIAQYWPMRTFVHHNPLHSLEYLPFEEAVRRGEQFLGGSGYLPSEVYRKYLQSGRIQLRHLDQAIQPLARGQDLVVGSCLITHHAVLRACLTHGLCAPAEEPLDALPEHGSDEPQLDLLAHHLPPVVHTPPIHERIAATVQTDEAALAKSLPLSCWCDQTLGSQIVSQVNAELVKWCGAFLDEGHATWPMPGREQGFYAAWKALAAQEWSTCGIADSRRKISSLPDLPEEAVLDSLNRLGIPDEYRQDYLSLQLTALPGWAGFIKWRAEEQAYVWQHTYPVGLVKFLAVRLWYVRELVQQVCRQELGIDGTYRAILAYIQDNPQAYFMRKERAAGRLPARYAEQVDRLKRRRGNGWKELVERYQREYGARADEAARRAAARRLLTLAQALEIVPSVLLEASPATLKVLVEWMAGFPESAHGPVWLKALEAGYSEPLFDRLLRATPAQSSADPRRAAPRRPLAQSVYCIDVRSEPFRRHLELTGTHETYGFAGFFAVFIRYRAWGKEHDTEQFPVIMRAKNEVREVPRSYLEHVVSKHESRIKLVQVGHTLLHDLKENVVTPYVMVESLGWFFSLPIVGKTILPVLYHRWTSWLRRLFVPVLATCVTVNKLPPDAAEEMLVAEQRARIRKALRDRLGLHGSRVSPDFVDALRRRALDAEGHQESRLLDSSLPAGMTPEKLTGLVETLQRDYQINQRTTSRQKERITRTGFTIDEQVLTVETALRMMGLTRNFARLVLLCAHGSTTENNPFEAALDCGACGGNEGSPNARVLAGMANNLAVRERLVKLGIEIPADTHFLAGQMDTTTDEVRLFDLEDVPPTHAQDIAQLLEDLREAGRLTSRERCSRLPGVEPALTPKKAKAAVHRRSVDWSQVRPEWGLSGNAALIIGRRELTRGLHLDGRVFLHSYDYREDPTNRLLEVLLTGPQVVAQWINMEHYFSTVDNEVYGGGTKIYHNVVGRLGIMSGPWSDLRLGLAWQTVMNGDMPHHEPLRLVTVIEAPRARIEKLIARHELLRHYYHHEWVHLAALEPEEGRLYRYAPTCEWKPVEAVRTWDMSDGFDAFNDRKGVRTWAD